LADDHAALILVDGDQEGWHFWTATPKSSPATRRIPIFLIANAADARETALVNGADLALTPDELLEQSPQLITEYARTLAPELAEQLDCECQEELPPLGVQAVEQFNIGEYYHQHDMFEEQWMHTTGPVRDLYRAVLQVGIAYYQITRGNHRGALKMLLRSVQWFALLPDVCQGIDIKQLREDSFRVRAELEKMIPADIAFFVRSLLKPVRMVEKS
jgi:predicted metal-dependent hydrolase